MSNYDFLPAAEFPVVTPTEEIEKLKDQICEIRGFLIDFTDMLKEETGVLEEFSQQVVQPNLLIPIMKLRHGFLNFADKYIEALRSKK